MTDSTLKLPYVDKDYDAILANIKETIPALTTEWTDFLESDIGFAQIRLFAALIDFNNFYLDRQAAETFLTTCDERASGVAISKGLGYSPKELSPSSTTARFSIQSAYASTLTLPQGTVCSIAGIGYFIAEDATIPVGNLFTEVTVTQGSIYSTNFVSSGQQWYKIAIPATVANVVVLVDGVAWTPVDSFIYTATPTCFKIGEDQRGKLLQFGGGVTATVPPQGSVIDIYGVMCSGAAGNLTQSDLAITLVDTIYDGNDNQITQLFQGVTLEPAVTGSDAEDLQSIKENAPAFYTTQHRAVTADDYAALARVISGVVGVTAWGGEEVGRYGEVFVCVYGSDKANVPQTLQDAVYSELFIKRTVPMQVVVLPPAPVRLNVTIDLYLNQFVTIALARNSAVTAVDEYLSTLNIGQLVQKSDIIELLVVNSDVDYTNLTFSCSMDGTIISDILDIELPNHVIPESLAITQDGDQIWAYGEGTSSFLDNRLYVSLTGNGSAVEINFESSYDDIYPMRHQLMVTGALAVNTYRSNQPGVTT